MGNNYNFTERWKNDSKYKRIKPFHSELTTKKLFVYETQAIQKIENWKVRKVQAKKSIR